MLALRALFTAWPDTALSAGGFAIGILFGALLNSTNYCAMGAISDWRTSGDLGRLGAVALAAATAICGAQLLDVYGVIKLSNSIYLNPRINWAGAASGGLLFGLSMVYAGGCPSRALVRAGRGDVRGIIVLTVLAIAAYATISGVLGAFRSNLDSATALDLRRFGAATQSLEAIIGLAGWNDMQARGAAIAAVALPLLIFTIGPARILSQPRNLAAGLGVGVLAIAGWVTTGLAADDFAANPIQPASLSFVRPVADAIDWIERSTALGLPGFGVSSVFGVFAGALVSGWIMGNLRFAAFGDAADLKRHLFGGIGMGVGGVLALGCTVGQGISGLSTLSAQSLIAAAAITVGGVLGLMTLERHI